MMKQPEELKRLVNVAADLVFPVNVRTDTIKFIANMATREAFLALLELAANEQLTKGERELALKYARDIVRAGH